MPDEAFYRRTFGVKSETPNEVIKPVPADGLENLRTLNTMLGENPYWHRFMKDTLEIYKQKRLQVELETKCMYLGYYGTILGGIGLTALVTKWIFKKDKWCHNCNS